MNNNKNRIAAILIFILAFISVFFIMQSIQSDLANSTMRLGIDLYPRWVGTESVLHGQSPYSLETRQHIWQLIYGSSDQPQGNPFGYYYPPAITTLLMPFILIGVSVNFMAVLWCAFLWAMWFTIIALWTAQFPRNNVYQKLIIALLLISGLFYRPAFSNYILGQYSLFCISMFIAAWIFHQSGRDILAGLFISLSLIKPSLTIIPVFLFVVFYLRNLKSFISIVTTSILLYLPPTLILGWWIPDFLNDISKYVVENKVSWFAGDIPTISGIVWLLLAFVLVILGLSIKDNMLALSSALALNAIFVPHTADYDLIVFIGLLFWAGDYWLREERRLLLIEFIFLIVMLFPWISLVVFLQSGLPQSVENWYRFIWLIYPIIVLLFTLCTFQFKAKDSLLIIRN